MEDETITEETTTRTVGEMLFGASAVTVITKLVPVDADGAQIGRLRTCAHRAFPLEAVTAHTVTPDGLPARTVAQLLPYLRQLYRDLKNAP